MKKLFFLIILMGIQAFAMKNEHKKEAHTSHVSTNNNETNKPKKKSIS
jgi:hypothetical protein